MLKLDPWSCGIKRRTAPCALGVDRSRQDHSWYFGLFCVASWRGFHPLQQSCPGQRYLLEDSAYKPNVNFGFGPLANSLHDFIHPGYHLLNSDGQSVLSALATETDGRVSATAFWQRRDRLRTQRRQLAVQYPTKDPWPAVLSSAMWPIRVSWLSPDVKN